MILTDFPWLDPIMEMDAANFLEPDTAVAAALPRRYAEAIRKELGNHTPEEIEAHFRARSNGGQPVFGRRLFLAALHMQKEREAAQ